MNDLTLRSKEQGDGLAWTLGIEPRPTEGDIRVVSSHVERGVLIARTEALVENRYRLDDLRETAWAMANLPNQYVVMVIGTGRRRERHPTFVRIATDLFHLYLGAPAITVGRDDVSVLTFTVQPSLGDANPDRSQQALAITMHVTSDECRRFGRQLQRRLNAATRAVRLPPY